MAEEYNAFTLAKQSRRGEDHYVVDSDDDVDTVGMESSEDGFSDTSTVGKLKEHPLERRQKSQRVSLCILVVFFVAISLTIKSLSRKEDDKVTTIVGDGMKPLGGKSSNSTTVYCSGRLGYSLTEWLEEDDKDSSSLCDPDFQPGNENANLDKPVKVFIMMGEANMVGAGQAHGNVEGTLDYTVRNKKRFTHLVGYDKEWKPRRDVRYVAVNGNFRVQRNEWLSVYDQHHSFGPELQVGYILGELLDEPVLLLKSCSGHSSLGGDLLPPGSQRYEHEGYVYAGYGESPRRWEIGSTPYDKSWRAGQNYDRDIANAWKVLRDIEKYYPGATSYEVAGFLWWQGDFDRRYPAYVSRYRDNLKRFIGSVRQDFGAPNAKFAVATVGQQGQDMEGSTLRVLESQVAVGTIYPEFHGNVATVDIRSSWRGSYKPGFEGDDSNRDGAHYGNNAETVMEVGNALGLTMAKLLRNE